MSDNAETVRCSLCSKEHQSILLHGVTIIPCPEMPENIVMPLSTLEAFMAGKSMLDQPLILIT